MTIEQAKEAAGRHAAACVRDGMRVGLGSGSTVRSTILELAARRLRIACVATSEATHRLAREHGLDVRTPDELGRLDLAIDGADEVDQAFHLIKGGGGALTREKIVVSMADRVVIVVDRSKLVPRLGAFPLPVEVLDFAPGILRTRLAELGARTVTTRAARSDNGLLLLDAAFGSIPDPARLARRLDPLPGLVEHGLFLAEHVDEVVVGDRDGSVEVLVRPR